MYPNFIIIIEIHCKLLIEKVYLVHKFSIKNMNVLKLSIVLTLAIIFNSNAQKQKNLDNVSVYKKEVKQAVLDFFEGFHQGDTSKIKAVIDATMILKTIGKTKDGKVKIENSSVDDFLKVIHNRPSTQRWNEQLLLFKIEADADIAHVWTPYEFYFNEKFSHCGINIFQLYNDGNQWRILNITDTRHREGCNVK